MIPYLVPGTASVRCKIPRQLRKLKVFWDLGKSKKIKLWTMISGITRVLFCFFFFQILINPAIDPALPESDSTLISAGTSTSLSIRQEVIKRKGSPYGDCFTDWPKDKLKFADEFLSLWPVYNQKACEQYCIQRYMFETCSCAQSYFR